jgi:hypothetical protein
MHLKEVFIMKRFLASALALTVIASGLTACSSASEESAVNNANGEVLTESRESENGASDNRVVYPPFIVIVLSTDGSAEAREYMNEVADYAMTYES